MLGEFKVSRCSRQCYGENRPLKEGEWYYSVVLDAEDSLQRRDYSASAWNGPPEGTLGYWKCRMPQQGERKLVLAPRSVLVDLLRQMDSAEHSSDSNAEPADNQNDDALKLRYLLALMLLRRRFVRVAAQPADFVGDENQDTQDRDAAAVEDQPMPRRLCLEVVEDGTTIEVDECDIARSETESLSERLMDLLYTEASEIDQD